MSFFDFVDGILIVQSHEWFYAKRHHFSIISVMHRKIDSFIDYNAKQHTWMRAQTKIILISNEDITGFYRHPLNSWCRLEYYDFHANNCSSNMNTELKHNTNNKSVRSANKIHFSSGISPPQQRLLPQTTNDNGNGYSKAIEMLNEFVVIMKRILIVIRLTIKFNFVLFEW